MPSVRENLIAAKAYDNAVCVGMAIAAGIIMQGHGAEVEAEEILRAAGLITVKEMRSVGVDWYDIRLLAPVLRTIRDHRRYDLGRRAIAPQEQKNG